MTEQNDVDSVVDMLNEAIELDPRAMCDAFSVRINCTDKGLGDSVWITTSPGGLFSPDTVGIMGFINGILSRLNYDKIRAVYRDDGTLVRFERNPNV
jgi:hypothetical protein